MSQSLFTWQTFNDASEIEPLTALLKENEIEFDLKIQSNMGDFAFAGPGNIEPVNLMLRPEDFNRVERLYQALQTDLSEEFPDDHYFFDFSQEELMEVIQKPDEWTRPDISLARRLLEQKGVKMDFEEIERLRQIRLKELASPEKPSNTLVFLGYLLAFMVPVIGIFIGLLLFNSKKAVPDGRVVPTYTESGRKQGRIMFAIGITVGIAFGLLFFMNAT